MITSPMLCEDRALTDFLSIFISKYVAACILKLPHLAEINFFYLSDTPIEERSLMCQSTLFIDKREFLTPDVQKATLQIYLNALEQINSSSFLSPQMNSEEKRNWVDQFMNTRLSAFFDEKLNRGEFSLVHPKAVSVSYFDKPVLREEKKHLVFAHHLAQEHHYSTEEGIINLLQFLHREYESADYQETSHYFGVYLIVHRMIEKMNFDPTKVQFMKDNIVKHSPTPLPSLTSFLKLFLKNLSLSVEDLEIFYFLNSYSLCSSPGLQHFTHEQQVLFAQSLLDLIQGWELPYFVTSFIKNPQLQSDKLLHKYCDSLIVHSSDIVDSPFMYFASHFISCFIEISHSASLEVLGKMQEVSQTEFLQTHPSLYSSLSIEFERKALMQQISSQASREVHKI